VRIVTKKTQKTEKTAAAAIKAVPPNRRRASTRAPLATASTAHEPTHDEVAKRAYFIYLARVGTCGDPDQDWAAALSELRKERRLNLQGPQD
jgi:hypothetical protein